MENGIGPRISLHPKKNCKPDYVQWLNDLHYWWTTTAELTVENTKMIQLEIPKLGSYAYKFWTKQARLSQLLKTWKSFNSLENLINRDFLAQFVQKLCANEPNWHFCICIVCFDSNWRFFSKKKRRQSSSDTAIGHGKKHDIKEIISLDF